MYRQGKDRLNIQYGMNCNGTLPQFSISTELTWKTIYYPTVFFIFGNCSDAFLILMSCFAMSSIKARASSWLGFLCRTNKKIQSFNLCLIKIIPSRNHYHFHMQSNQYYIAHFKIYSLLYSYWQRRYSTNPRFQWINLNATTLSLQPADFS